jgi:uncharacterized protein YkwD
MLRPLIFLLLFILTSRLVYSQTTKTDKQVPEICFSQTEKELYKLINEYRATKGLPAVKLSVSLCFVAQTHARDQAENYKSGSRCNMHSWSDKGKWTAGCYTPDHKNAKIMWAKPRELTNYQADGFEISFFSTYLYATPLDQAIDILAGWKKSPHHNDVILNKDIWKQIDWKAIGIGVHGNYADVWFGAEEDKDGEIKICDN